MISAVNDGAVSFDAYHTLTIKRAPSALALFASNGEVTAANDVGRLESVASALDLLGVTRVELQLAKAAISFTELYGDNGRASALDETLDEGSLVGSYEGAGHGKNRRRGSRLVARTIVWIQPSSVACSNSVTMS